MLASEGRLLLYAQRFICLSLIVFIAGTYAIPWEVVRAQAPDQGSANFIGVKQSDRVGSNGAYPDGKPDAVFHVSLDPRQGDASIKRIELRVVSGPPGRWSSTLGTPGTGYLGLAHSKRTSFILNRDGGSLALNPKEGRDFLLFVTDDGHFNNPNRRYEILIFPVDGKSWRMPVSTGAAEEQGRPAETRGSFPVRMSAILRGISQYDAVNPGKTMAGDDKGDGLFVISLETRQRVITAIQIKNVGGIPSVWDTLPNSGNGAIGVAMVSDPVRMLNRRDGSVLINVPDRVDLNLYVADNGSIAEGNTDYRVTVTFYDGGVAWSRVKRDQAVVRKPPDQAPPAPREPARQEISQVKFLGSWQGGVTTDAVGKYPALKPDGIGDALFVLDIQVLPKNFITGIEILSTVDSSQKWGTGGTPRGAWGLAVARQSDPTVLLNNPDGSVRIPIDGREQFNLYAADPGGLAIASQSMRVIVHMADGSSYQQFVRRPVGLTQSVVPDRTGEPPRARGLVTCQFRGFIADLVNSSTRPGKDGYLDGTFITKVRAGNRTITAISIRDADGVVRWSSQPKGPVSFLGVALYPKIFNLINRKGDPLDIKIAGHKTIYLYAADNRLLSDAAARLSVELTFADKSTITADVIK